MLPGCEPSVETVPRGLLRVLFIEDTPADVELALAQLTSAGFEVKAEVVDSPERLGAALAAGFFDVILADYRLPGWNGMAALEQVRQAGVSTPFVLVTGTLGDELAVECVKRGIPGYVLKEKLVRLPFVVARVLREKALEDERSRAAEESERLLRHFRSIIEHSHDLISIVDAQGVILYQSPSAERVLGYRPDEMVGRSGFGYIHPDDRDRIGDLLSRGVLEPGASASAEYRCLHRDGSWRFVHAIGTNLLDDPAVGGVVINARDVTLRIQAQQQLQAAHDLLERRVEERTAELSRINAELRREILDRERAQAALGESEDKYRMLMEHAADAILLTDFSGQLCEANRAACAMLAYSRGELLRLSLTDVVPEIAARIPELQARMASGELLRLEADYRRKDGSFLPVEASVRRIGDNLVQSIARDISGRREMERLKDEVVSTVSHELRTPLASLSGFAELMLAREFPPEKQREFLGIIHRESRRLTELINNFLDLQRLESGKQIYRFRPLDLPALVRDAAEVFRGDAAHPLRLEFAGPLPAVRADPDRIRQVLSNLLSNAVKYSPDGGEIVVSAQCSGREVSIAVADHGIGIPPDSLPRLFRKFYRGDNAVIRGIGGTGLGLALVRQIVENHGGRVWAESCERGSVLRFTLPLAAGEESSTKSEPQLSSVA